MDYTESHLRRNKWFAGETLSGADIMMSFPLMGFTARTSNEAQYPKITEYVARVKALPAWIRAEEKVGQKLFNNTGR